jgi:UDP-GlcNAc:undecaprenyl-phosphate GlcNAc-1-phosphate transferase
MTLQRVELLLVFFGSSMLAALASVPAAALLARRIGLVDRPDGRRKLHARITPVSGGLAILLAALGVLLLGLLLPGTSDLLGPLGREMRGLLLGAVVICLVGVADDYRGLRGRHKVLGQLVAVGLVLAHGVRVDAVHLFSWRIEMGALALPFTLFWLLGAINSLNLLDGMDGLLGSVGTIVALAMAVMAGMYGHWIEACVAVTLAGALVGFLRYNLPPASIFLGDAGSMLIGLVIGTLAIRSSLKGPATVALSAPTALLIIPIFDTLAAITRRKLTGRSIYSTDRGHLHHCLLRHGLSCSRALLTVSCLCLLTVLGTLASVAWQREVLALLSALAVVAILVLTRLFGHAEMMLVLKSCGALARSLAGGAPGRTGNWIEVRLQGSADWRDLWGRLLGCTARLNLRSLVLDVNAPAVQESYHARWFRSSALPDHEEPEGWSAKIPLRAAGQPVGHITLTGSHDGEAVWRKVAAVGEVAEQIEAILEVGARPRPVVPPTEEQLVAPWMQPEDHGRSSPQAAPLQPAHVE